MLKKHEMACLRVRINAVDIMILAGCSIGKAWDIMRKMRAEYKKPRPKFLTFAEFSAYSGVTEKEVNKYLLSTVSGEEKVIK